MAMLLSRNGFCALATVSLVMAGSAAMAAAPAPVGKRALLTLNIQVDGAGQRSVRSDGTDVKWSTQRTFEAKIELVADKPQGMSIAGATGQAPSAGLQALQKEAENCRENDMECQMALVAKMMESDDVAKLMQQAQGTQAASGRYQSWKVPEKGGRIDVKGSYQEQWDGVFLTASREVRNCKHSGSAATNPSLAAKDREALETGLKGLTIETDTQTGKGWLMPVVGSYINGERVCQINNGGRASTEREAKALVLVQPKDLKSSAGGWLEGASATGTTIARGEMTFATPSEARALTGVMSVTAPLNVKVRWELVPL